GRGAGAAAGAAGGAAGAAGCWAMAGWSMAGWSMAIPADSTNAQASASIRDIGKASSAADSVRAASAGPERCDKPPAFGAGARRAAENKRRRPFVEVATFIRTGD